MANGRDNCNAVDRVVIDLHSGPASLDLDHVDVEVNDGVSFEVAGRIEDIEDETLAALSGHTLSPAEIHFITKEDTG